MTFLRVMIYKIAQAVRPSSLARQVNAPGQRAKSTRQVNAPSQRTKSTSIPASPLDLIPREGIAVAESAVSPPRRLALRKRIETAVGQPVLVIRAPRPIGMHCGSREE